MAYVAKHINTFAFSISQLKLKKKQKKIKDEIDAHIITMPVFASFLFYVAGIAAISFIGIKHATVIRPFFVSLLYYDLL